MKVGFTGTRWGMRADQLVILAATLQELDAEELDGIEEFHHGDCVGADHEAHVIAQAMSIPVILHPPIIEKNRAWSKDAWETRDNKPFLERNHDMVDECDVIIAAPRMPTEQLRSGTWATIRYAQAQEKRLKKL